MNKIMWDKIDARIDRVFALSEKNEEKLDRMTEERILATKEREIADKRREESLSDLDKKLDRLHEAVFGVNSEVKGIAKSNGMVAEDYFYESLNKSKTFGGIHFDIVTKNMKGAQKQKDGSKLEGQYDVVMINDNAVCIVEIKYRLRLENVLEIAEKHVHTFKKLFPAYEKYDIYLAVGGMTVEELDNNIIDTAKQLGVGVIKVKGGDLELLDENLKVY